MKTEEKIILYLDNQLSEAERHKFETELAQSHELRTRFLRMKTQLEEYKRLRTPQTDESYFINMVPEFRRRNPEKKYLQGKIPKLALILPVLLVLTFAVILLFRNAPEEPGYELADLSNEELREAAEYVMPERTYLSAEMDERHIAERVDSAFTQNFLAEKSEYYMDQSDYSALLSSLSEEEADIIYNEIIDKDILDGKL